MAALERKYYQIYISKDALKQHLKDEKKYAPNTIDEMLELYVKLVAIENEPTTMEVTVTAKQLYDMGVHCGHEV